MIKKEINNDSLPLLPLSERKRDINDNELALSLDKNLWTQLFVNFISSYMKKLDNISINDEITKSSMFHEIISNKFSFDIDTTKFFENCDNRNLAKTFNSAQHLERHKSTIRIFRKFLKR